VVSDFWLNYRGGNSLGFCFRAGIQMIFTIYLAHCLLRIKHSNIFPEQDS